MKKGTKKEPNPNTRATHQMLLNTKELDELYMLAEVPKTENKSVALRMAIERHKEQLTENNNLKQLLKQLQK